MSIIVNRHITFIDSLQFYNGSLDTLASNLNNEDFKHLISESQNLILYSSLKDGKRNRSNGHISDKNINT